MAIAVAGLLAAGSIWTGILRDTVIHLARVFSRELPDDLVAEAPPALCLLYWTIFLSALLLALFLAVLDIRYIKLQYALEKQQLVRQSLGEDLSHFLRDPRDR